MPTPILMPKLSDDMREGKIIAWRKKEGDAVESGEAIAEVETDKANLEVEAYNAGRLVRIIVQVGQTVAVGQPIAEVQEEDEAAGPPAATAAPIAPASPAARPPAAPVPARESAAAAAASTPAAASAPASAPAPSPALSAGSGEEQGGERIKASPLARRMARDGNLDLRVLQGSGPGGRVVRVDVERAMTGPAPAVRAAPAPAQPSPAFTLAPAAAVAPAAASPKREAPRPPPPPMREETLPLSGMRKAIARRMAEAKPGAPHFYLSVDVDMTRAFELRKQINAELAPDWGSTVSVNDLVLRAAVIALQRRPEVNSSFAGEQVKRHGSIHLGFALSVEDGLLTPVIRDAQSKSLGQLARESRDLAERGRARKLRPDEYQGGTFTVSNLGMYGIREFSAIINPGEAAILAVGAVEKRPVVRDDQLAVGQVMTATLSGDHRVIDGALGAQLLQEFRAALEQPLRLLG